VRRRAVAVAVATRTRLSSLDAVAPTSAEIKSGAFYTKVFHPSIGFNT
jgi:hypothetical protein